MWGAISCGKPSSKNGRQQYACVLTTQYVAVYSVMSRDSCNSLDVSRGFNRFMSRQRKLPSGIWKRGDAYYARFRAGGRLVRKRLSTDFDAACQVLNDLKARADRADFNLI